MGKEEFNYLGIFLGNTDDVREEVEGISVGDKIAWAESKNVSIVTFVSILKNDELNLHFNNTKVMKINRNFFIMRVEDAAISFSSSDIQDRMFEVFEIANDPTEDYDLELMSTLEKEVLIDEILDKGANLSPYDQKLLTLLTK